MAKEEEKKIEELALEMRKTFESLKESNDKRIDEIEKRGHATAESKETVEKINTEITELRKEIKALHTRAGRTGAAHAGAEGADGAEGEGPDVELRAAAYEKYIRYGMGENAAVSMSPEEKRALAGTSDSDGQFLVPDGFEANIIMKAFNNAEIRPLCQVGTTGRDTVKMGSLSKPVVTWGTRGLAVDEQTLSTGGIVIPIKNIRALALVSNDTLEDSAANIMGELEDGFEKAVAEAEDDAFIVGAAPDSPKGILLNALVQANFKSSGVAADIADATHNGFDVLKQLLFSLKKTYRRNATWAMNSITEGEYRLLKDGEGKYLWGSDVDKNGNPVLMGRPVVNPEGMPDIAAGAFPVVLGDFRSGYKIRDRAGLTIKRLVERYSEFDQTGFLLKKRVGGGVALPEAFACLKIGA